MQFLSTVIFEKKDPNDLNHIKFSQVQNVRPTLVANGNYFSQIIISHNKEDFLSKYSFHIKSANWKWIACINLDPPPFLRLNSFL